mgnify:CR=1 FL=1
MGIPGTPGASRQYELGYANARDQKMGPSCMSCTDQEGRGL